MAQLTITNQDTEFLTAVILVLTELEKAEKKHPKWPKDYVKRAAIVLEEAGELIREANLLDEGKGSLENIKTECVQTAATSLRLLKIMGGEK